MSEIKMLEVRDKGTFIPVICIKPIPENEAQGYLLRRDGYSLQPFDSIIIMIDAQCRGVAYDPYDWGRKRGSRTHMVAHRYIQDHWAELKDGDVIDVEFIEGETDTRKTSERLTSL